MYNIPITCVKGRTAKLFLFHDDNPEELREKFQIKGQFSQLSKFILEVNPEIKKERIKQLIDEYCQYQIDMINCRRDWIERYADILNKLEIDIFRIYDFIQPLEGFDERGTPLYSELARAFKFPS